MGRAVPILALAGLGSVWALSIPLTKIAVSTGHHPFGLLFWQFFIGSVCLYGLTVLRKSTIILDKRHLIFFAAICFMGTLIPNTTSLTAAFHLPGGVMALVIATVPLFSLLVALLIRLEGFEAKRFAGVILGLSAMALIILPETSLPDPSKAIFVILALVAPLCYGIEANYLSLRQPADTGPIATLFGASVLGTMITLPLSVATGTFINPLDGMGAPEWAQAGSSLLHVVGYTGYIWLVGAAGAVFASQVGYVVTVGGVLFSMAILGEEPSPYLWTALVLLMVALTLVRPREKESASDVPVQA